MATTKRAFLLIDRISTATDPGPVRASASGVLVDDSGATTSVLCAADFDVTSNLHDIRDDLAADLRRRREGDTFDVYFIDSAGRY